MISLTGVFGLKSISLIFIIAFVALLNFTADGAGELDSSFNASAYGTTNGTINAVKKQPDGKILIGGKVRGNKYFR